MKDERIEKLASLLVDYSVEVKPGDRVMVNFIGPSTLPAARAVVERVLAAGGTPVWMFDDSPLTRDFVLGASEEQAQSFAELHRSMMEKVDCYIGIRGSDNQFELADVPPEKLALYRKTYVKKVHLEVRVPSTRWVVLRWPTPSMAQQAKTSTDAFEEFYFRVCTLDYPAMSRAMDPLVELMSRTDRVRITAPGTDLTFSIKDIPVIKCDGKMNIPDGEIFTAPVKESVEGVITYNTPSVHEGVLYENIRLVFEKGRIVEASARSDTERLNEVFDVDEGARYVGEFAIGVNPHILHPMNDTLFDEKIAGSIHFTPGNSYDEAFNGNRSSLHWDLVLIQRPDYGGGEIWFDDVLVRKDGLFVLDELKGLNPESLV